MRKDKPVMIGNNLVDIDEDLKLTLDSNFNRVKKKYIRIRCPYCGKSFIQNTEE